ncbi:MAG: HAMP domain-containing protein [bacterium]|nr:HAMP domain-containing protein [bacterium]
MRPKISHRLMAAVAATTLLAFGLFVVWLIGSQHAAMTSEIELQANQLSETIKSSTRYAMLRNRPDQVHEIIDTIGRQEGIDRVRVFNKEGEVSYADDKLLIGTFVDKDAESCYACHAADAPLERLSMSQRTRTFMTENGFRTLGIINPIYNETSCSNGECHAHPAAQTVLGVLDVTMSLESVDRHMAANRNRALILVPSAILAASAIIWILFRFLVDKPLLQLLKATDAVASGNLDYKLEVKRNDEFGQLDESFNTMTEKLAEAQKQIYQSNKLASLGQLTAGIAHEINNPLTGVLTYSSFLLKRAPDDSETKQDLVTVVREAKRCREIVKGLLDFSRQAPTHKTYIDCNQVIERSLDIVDNQLSVGNIGVTKTLQPELPRVMGDGNQLVQVLINLLVNAADAIGEGGGEIFISSDVMDPENGRQVEIKVADSGCGIPRDHIDRIFEPFFTTKATEGTGLGLAVVWGIVQEHGGTVSVNSKPERGTTFTLLLPAEPGTGLTDAEEAR